MYRDNSFVKDPLIAVTVGSCKVEQENRKTQQMFSKRGRNEVLHDH